MSSPPSDVTALPRIASQQELSTMSAVLEKHDRAKQLHDYAALMATFHPDVIGEIKPAGLRICSFTALTEMYRRTLPKLSAAFLARSKAREWSNQTGLLREWLYPVNLPSGEVKLTRQLEIFEFCDGLKLIKTYRVRMNTLYSGLFVAALGEDYASLPGVERLPG